MDSAFVLKYVDEVGEAHFTLHHNLEDAQAYRALIIANLIGQGALNGDDATLDVICNHLLSGDFGLAFETFAQWCEHSDEYEDIHFDIRQSHMSHPTNMHDIFEALSALGVEDTDEVDVKVESVVSQPPPLPKRPTLRDQLHDVVGSLSLAESGATIDDEPTNEPKVRVLTEADLYDEVSAEDIADLERYFQKHNSYRVRPKTGVEIIESPKRIDGSHTGNMLNQVVDRLRQSLTPHDPQVTVAREYPKVRHVIKK